MPCIESSAFGLSSLGSLFLGSLFIGSLFIGSLIRCYGWELLRAAAARRLYSAAQMLPQLKLDDNPTR